MVPAPPKATDSKEKEKEKEKDKPAVLDAKTEGASGFHVFAWCDLDRVDVENAERALISNKNRRFAS